MGVSIVSKLKELIQQLCPNGVEYKKLGEIATITRGGSFQKKDYVETGVPCIHYGQIYTQYNLFAEKTVSFISEVKAKKQKMAEQNDVIMAVTSENIDDVCKCIAWLGEEKVAVSGHTAIVHHNIDPKYLVYYLHSSMFHKQKIKLAHGTKVIEVTPDKLLDVILPVPPVEIQREIVYILDNFTELTADLTADLTAELTARKKQYEYYREKILSQTNNAEQCALQDIVADSCSISYGIVQTGDDVEIGVPVVRPVDLADKIVSLRGLKRVAPSVAESYKRTVLQGGDLLLCVRGTTGVIAIASDELKGCNVSRGIVPLTFKSTVCPQYIYYQFLSQGIQREIQSKTRGTALKQINMEDLRKIHFHVPTLGVQKQIVSILERFDVLCNDITSGLSAEIEARQKQYEYYRDKLLTFKQLS